LIHHHGNGIERIEGSLIVWKEQIKLQISIKYFLVERRGE
jgi:hypothetical protein